MYRGVSLGGVPDFAAEKFEGTHDQIELAGPRGHDFHL